MNLSEKEITNLLIKFFPNLNNIEINQFLSITEYHKVKSKEIILKSGRTDKTLILILKGVAKAYSINDKGGELNDYIRAEGHLMGDARVFGDGEQILNIESISELHFLKFDVRKLEKLGYNNPEIMTFYLDFLKEIILTLSHRLNTFVTMTPRERYLDLIKWNPILIESAFDKDLASFLGITPLTLHRIKKKLELHKE